MKIIEEIIEVSKRLLCEQNCYNKIMENNKWIATNISFIYY